MTAITRHPSVVPLPTTTPAPSGSTLTPISPPSPPPVPPPADDVTNTGLTFKDRMGTALYYGVQPAAYSAMAAAMAAKTGIWITGVALMAPMEAGRQGLESSIEAAYNYLRDPNSPDALPQRALGVSMALTKGGIEGTLRSLAATACSMGDSGILGEVGTLPITVSIACVGFWTLGITTPAAMAYGFVQHEAKTPQQFFEEVKNGQHRLPIPA